VEAVVDALSSHSLSICLSFPCQRRADLVSAALLTSLLQVPELREPLGEAHDLAALETALEKTRSVLAKLKAAHILPPCARDEEPFITINLRDEEELPKEIDAKIALPACLSRSVVSRLVFLDSGDARISCSFAGVSLFSDGSGDTTCVTLLLSPELQQQTRRICNLDTISPSDGDAKLLKALFYSGFLVEHE
jgi:hypothetical protein